MLKAVGSGFKSGFSAPAVALPVGSTGGSPQDEGADAAKRGQEEGAAAAKRGEEERRRGLGEGMRGTAAGFRARADELERVANQPGQSLMVRESNLGIAKGLRGSAGDLEDKANKLNDG
jgi:hypothetical protein